MVLGIVLAMNKELVKDISVLIYSIQKHISNAKIYLITDKELSEYPDWVYKYGVLDLDIETIYGKWTKHMFLKIHIDLVIVLLKPIRLQNYYIKMLIFI